jgi:hypothetical protein
MLFVYRQSESIFTYYELMQAVMNNATLKAAAELHDPLNASLLCGGGGIMAFSEDLYASYWADVVGGEIGSEPGVNAVFFDGYDKLCVFTFARRSTSPRVHLRLCWP